MRTDDDAIDWHVLARYLQPTARRSAQIDTTSRRLQKVVLLVELDELEGRPSAVALLSGNVQYKSVRRSQDTRGQHAHFASL